MTGYLTNIEDYPAMGNSTAMTTTNRQDNKATEATKGMGFQNSHPYVGNPLRNADKTQYGQL